MADPPVLSPPHLHQPGIDVLPALVQEVHNLDPPGVLVHKVPMEGDGAETGLDRLTLLMLLDKCGKRESVLQEHMFTHVLRETMSCITKA